MIFVYHCNRCGQFECSYPIGHAPSDCACPRCGASAARLFTPFTLCLKRGRTDLDGSHLPQTPAEKAYWRERSGVDVDKVQVAINGFRQ